MLKYIYVCVRTLNFVKGRQNSKFVIFIMKNEGLDCVQQHSLIGKQNATYLIYKRQDYYVSFTHTLHHKSRVRLTVVL